MWMIQPSLKMQCVSCRSASRHWANDLSEDPLDLLAVAMFIPALQQEIGLPDGVETRDVGLRRCHLVPLRHRIVWSNSVSHGSLRWIEIGLGFVFALPAGVDSRLWPTAVGLAMRFHRDSGTMVIPSWRMHEAGGLRVAPNSGDGIALKCFFSLTL